MPDEREERIARNEAVFRTVNEGIRSGNEGAGGPTAYLCECGVLGCNLLIELRAEEYEAVRADPSRFALVPGHEIPDVEDVVERHDGYLVVRKKPETRPIAEQTDPRR
jgi:hypothetical protein